MIREFHHAVHLDRDETNNLLNLLKTSHAVDFRELISSLNHSIEYQLPLILYTEECNHAIRSNS